MFGYSRITAKTEAKDNINNLSNLGYKSKSFLWNIYQLKGTFSIKMYIYRSVARPKILGGPRSNVLGVLYSKTDLKFPVFNIQYI